MTVNKELPKRYDPNEIEKRWKDFWLDNNSYAWDKTKSRDETFVVDTPPPTVSGSLHLGHVFSYAQTDFIVRYNRMKGKNIFYPMGWDDNGLPTERRVQNAFGIRCDLDKQYEAEWKPNRHKGKKDPIEEVSRKNFIETCSLLTQEDEEVYKSLWQNLGLSIDWSLEYATINSHCRKVSQISFLDLFEKDQVFNADAPTQWDVDFQTAVAQAEVEDRQEGGFYHDIKFLVEETGDEFIVSTTRPELLAACIAVVAHPDDKRYKNLIGKHAITPLFKAKVPILASEHADPEKGSGILMVCTFGDSADIDWWKKSDLPIKQIIGRNGRILDVTFGEGPYSSIDPTTAQNAYDQIKGLKVKQARKKIVELLEDPHWGYNGTPLLVGAPEQTTRPVKFYEKGERPLEFIPTRQWYIKILKHRDELLEQGKKINWVPEHMHVRYKHWVEGLNQDWCISRQRYFGVPFPLWYKVKDNGELDYDNPLVASREQLPVDPLTDCPNGFSEDQRGVPGGFIAEKDVMDTWATSSCTPQVATHWGIDEKRHNSLFPMDLRPQSHEIIRTWAFYTTVKAYLHEGKIPWKNIAISGWILDPDRKKMSKSKGNVVTPDEYLSSYSSDAVRYWAARARLGVDTAFDENMFKIGRKLCNKLFNASKFVLMQLEDFKESELNDFSLVTVELDKMWLSKVLKLVGTCTNSYEKFDYAGSLHATEDAFWSFCDHYLELVKGRTYSKDNSSDRISGLITLNYSLKIFLKLFAPIFPYLTEEIWSYRYGVEHDDSIHKFSWPKVDLKDPKLEHILQVDDLGLELAKELLSFIRTQKTKEQKKLKWPVDSIEVMAKLENLKVLESVLPDVLLTGNVNPKNVTLTEESELEGHLCRAVVKLAANIES